MVYKWASGSFLTELTKAKEMGSFYIYVLLVSFWRLIKTEKIKLLKIENAIMPTDKKCPRCSSDALYKFGKTKNGKQRYRCQVCNRQFVTGKYRIEINKRPNCRSCGKPMYIYMRSDTFIRWRCSDYPKCRTFHKLKKEDALFDEILYS